MNATEHLIEALKATKRVDEGGECRSLRESYFATVDFHGAPALDLPALLSALAEIVVGEPCVSVPVREVESVVRFVQEYQCGNPSVNAIAQRLPAPKVDPIAELRDLLTAAKTNAENCRARDISGAEWWDAKVAPLEAAIAKMEKP